MSNQKKVEYLPRTQEYWMSCKFGFNTVKKTGYGYTWEVKPMEELPEALQNFRYNEKFTIKEFHQYVGKNFEAYANAGKLRVAFENLKARIDVYNESVREDATDIDKSVERAEALLGRIIKGQRKQLQKQIQELRAACLKIGVKPKLIEGLLDHPENYASLRHTVLLKAEDLELELPAIDVTTLETWMVPQLAGYTPYDVYSDEMPATYTDEERKVAPRNKRVIRWTQDITKALAPQREDMLILMTLYITQADDGAEIFHKCDKFGDKIERDMRPAPITDEEIREWKAYYEEEENKKLNTPVEWVGNQRRVF